MPRTAGARAYTDDEKRMILLAYRAGESTRAIAARLGRDPSGVWRQLVALRDDAQDVLPLEGSRDEQA